MCHVHELKAGIRQFFEFVIDIDDCARVKPAADPYLKALERFQATAAQALAIEDSSRGLALPRRPVWIAQSSRNSFTAPQDFRGAWVVLDSVRDLPRLLTG